MSVNVNNINPVVQPFVENNVKMPFLQSIIRSFALILTAELGDKTFIMLIILQLKANKITIVLSAILAELLMNLISILIGSCAEIMLYKNLVDYIALIFFFVYGIWLIGNSFNDNEQNFETDLNFEKTPNVVIENQMKKSEFINKELTIIPEDVKSEKGEDNSIINQNVEDNQKNIQIEDISFNGINNEENKNEYVDFKIFSAIFTTMIISECGDRTQISSITMSALFNIYGVLIGSSLALMTSCILGVYFGKSLVKYLHEKSLNILLGFIFLLYAIEIYKVK
jgi:putative Ca2+/H+ antiporter (TMEM165/GDT1 family)